MCCFGKIIQSHLLVSYVYEKAEETRTIGKKCTRKIHSNKKSAVPLSPGGDTTSIEDITMPFSVGGVAFAFFFKFNEARPNLTGS